MAELRLDGTYQTEVEAENEQKLSVARRKKKESCFQEARKQAQESNGRQKQAQILIEQFEQDLPKRHVLPSTSPANAVWTLPKLTDAWRKALTDENATFCE